MATDPITGQILKEGDPGYVAPTTPTTQPTGLIGMNTPNPITEAAKWNVDPNQTVTSQVQGIIAQNGPLQQLAETRAKQDQNAFGTLNTTGAIGAVEKARYDSALPIATADANMYGNAAKTNVDAQNSFNTASNLANTNAARDTNIFNQDLAKASNDRIATMVSDNNNIKAKIMADPNMSTDSKNKAIAELDTSFNAYLGSYKSLDAIGVTGLVDFTGIQNPVIPSTPTGTSAPGTSPANTQYGATITDANVATRKANGEQPTQADVTAGYARKASIFSNKLVWTDAYSSPILGSLSTTDSGGGN